MDSKENQRIVTAEYNGRDFESVFEIVQKFLPIKENGKFPNLKSRILWQTVLN